MLKKIVLVSLFALLVSVAIHPPKLVADGGPLPQCPAACPNSCVFQSPNNPVCPAGAGGAPYKDFTLTLAQCVNAGPGTNAYLTARWDSAGGQIFYATVWGSAGSYCMADFMMSSKHIVDYLCSHWTQWQPTNTVTLNNHNTPVTQMWRIDTFNVRDGGGHK